MKDEDLVANLMISPAGAGRTPADRRAVPQAGQHAGGGGVVRQY